MTSIAPSRRIESIDILRGIVMVIMALDHVRDYFSDYTLDPTDLQHAGTAMFITRWITHYCAPVFIFLSGTSAFLSSGGKTKKEISLRLLSRGLWLIFLELTFVRLGWAFDLDYSIIFLQVIWAIGVSMVVLSGLIFLPVRLILLLSLLMIFGHNAFDQLQPQGAAGVLWRFLHVQGMQPYGNGRNIFIIYPLIPWIGVLAAGYCFGAVFHRPAPVRNRWLYGTGLAAIGLFVVLRFSNVYGDPAPWHNQPVWWPTLLSFVNCTKYPPSLLYLLMTLGPAILSLPLLERMAKAVSGIFTVYGRVPLFYYILHIYLIHGMAVLFSFLFRANAPVRVFEHPGYALPWVYLFWLLAVAILYFPSRWFMRVKMRHRKWWLSYL